jgi:hypothetical protein
MYEMTNYFDFSKPVWNFVFVYCGFFVIWNLLFGAYQIYLKNSINKYFAKNAQNIFVKRLLTWIASYKDHIYPLQNYFWDFWAGVCVKF